MSVSGTGSSIPGFETHDYEFTTTGLNYLVRSVAWSTNSTWAGAPYLDDSTLPFQTGLHNTTAANATVTYTRLAVTCYLHHQPWSSGGYFDVYLQTSSGSNLWIHRLNTYQVNSTFNGAQHPGTTIECICSGWDLTQYPKIMLQNVTGALAVIGLGWKSTKTAMVPNAFVHSSNVYGNPGSLSDA